MRARYVLVGCLLAIALSHGAIASSGAASGNETVVGPRLVAVYPNPVAKEDVGEFVVIDTGNHTDLGGYALTDGESTVHLPNATVSGRVALSATPNRTRRLTTTPVLSIASVPSLSNAGERIRLVRENRTASTLSYPSAPEGEIYARGGWRVPGRTHRSPVTVADANATTFVLPDDPGIPRTLLRSANDSLLLAGYTFTSRRDERTLTRLAARGVHVRVLLEGHPIGGIPAREARVLARLERNGVTVSVFDGPHDPYAYHHAKYAIVDGRRVLVATENWEPQSMGGRGHRGWGVVVHSPRLADELTHIYDADAGGIGTRSWAAARPNATVENATSYADHRYPRSFAPERTRVNTSTLLVTPDDAGPRLVSLLDAANDSIRLEQMSVSNGTLLRHVVAAARRGVHVRILLSGAWYATQKNTATVTRLNALAARENLPLRAKLVAPHGRFDVVHAKGLVVDGQYAVVGSLNWNPQARTQNREALVLLHDRSTANYYAHVFDADWRGGSNHLPWPLALATLLAALGAAAWLKRVCVFEKGV